MVVVRGIRLSTASIPIITQDWHLLETWHLLEQFYKKQQHIIHQETLTVWHY